MPASLRPPLAILAGIVLGNFCALAAAIGIDASYGEEVTGGKWSFTLPNVIYAAIIGFLTGFFAGFIGKKRGGLLGALTQFLPLFFVVFVSVEQRILSLVMVPLLNLTKRYKPVFTRLAVVTVLLRLARYQHVPPPS